MARQLAAEKQRIRQRSVTVYRTIRRRSAAHTVVLAAKHGAGRVMRAENGAKADTPETSRESGQLRTGRRCPSTRGPQTMINRTLRDIRLTCIWGIGRSARCDLVGSLAMPLSFRSAESVIAYNYAF
jgi:hypothetical protein